MFIARKVNKSSLLGKSVKVKKNVVDPMDVEDIRNISGAYKTSDGREDLSTRI